MTTAHLGCAFWHVLSFLTAWRLTFHFLKILTPTVLLRLMSIQIELSKMIDVGRWFSYQNQCSVNVYKASVIWYVTNWLHGQIDTWLDIQFTSILTCTFYESDPCFTDFADESTIGLLQVKLLFDLHSQMLCIHLSTCMSTCSCLPLFAYISVHLFNTQRPYRTRQSCFSLKGTKEPPFPTLRLSSLKCWSL